MPESKKKRFILKFSEISNSDVPEVGGKNASLGEMYQKMTAKGINIPNGFALTAYAYRYFLVQTGLDEKLKKILEGLNTNDIDDLGRRGFQARQEIISTPFPHEIESETIEAYRDLSKNYRSKYVDVAVRSSATAEDLPDASFAGQQESYLNIEGDHALLNSTKLCIASLFTNRAISYRVDKHFDHFSIALSVGVQKMVRSDKASSGVMFSIDTESGFENVVLINSSYGLGENIVKGRVNPDEFYVFKPTLKKNKYPIISRRLGSKEVKMVYSVEGNDKTKNVPVLEKERNLYSINDQEVLILAKWAVMIEDHYKRPMDMEWAKDGKTNELFIVQARPETVQSNKNKKVHEEYRITEKGTVLVQGQSIGFKIGQGDVQVIRDVNEISQFEEGNVLVTEMTDPDWEPIMKKAAAIVTDSGGRTCHAAIVSRELGITAIVGTKNASSILKDGQSVTVSCAEGETGNVYKGLLKFKVKRTNLENIHMPKVDIMMNVGEPDQAFLYSQIPNNGVGLARQEFIITSSIKIHPLALLHYKKIKDKNTISQIDELTIGYSDKRKFYIDRLSNGIAQIAAAFYPKDVIVRLSDFKSNEYANLIGGKEYEPIESNPMIGFRGASRYYSEQYRPAFDMECEALKQVRDLMGLTNVKVMVPFCRTVEEGEKVIKIMRENGLKQGKNGLEVYVMCEIPSNVILADKFFDIFDGFSIGSNDLTQLIVGLDRDSDLISHISNERDESVKKMIADVIRVAKKRKKKIGICGQAPSDFPDFAAFLMKERIDSISLTPDSVIKTILALQKDYEK